MKKLILQLLLLTVACLYCSASMVDLLRVRLGKLPEQDFARIEATDFGDALVVTVPENRKQGSHWIMMKQLDLKPFRGKKLLFTVFAKGENIARAPAYYLGLKYMFAVRTETGKSYPQAPGLAGTFDWRKLSFEVQVPQDAISGELVAGLQETSGKVWFRNFMISQGGFLKPPVELPPGFRCEYTPEFLARPITRGVMSPDPLKVTEKDVDDLGSWGATNIRWQLKGSNEQAVDLEVYNNLIDRQLNRLEELLPAFERNGIHIIIDMHLLPGGRIDYAGPLGTAGEEAVAAYGNAAANRALGVEKYYRAYLDTWRKIARRFKPYPIVMGYDLFNEPVQSCEMPHDYLSIQYDAARAIREIDPERMIVISPNNWGGPGGFAGLTPLPLKNLVYQTHFYDPGTYTHQGIFKNARMGTRYPGMIDGVYADKKLLKKYLKPVVEFQKKYGARIYCGEFSVARYAPGGAQYLRDVISLFEEYGWDWSYHAFRESHYWSVEHAGSDGAHPVPARDTDRKRVLLEAFKKNRKFK